MQLILSNAQSFDLNLDQSSLGETYLTIYKHLSNVEIPFNVWDNPYYIDNITYEELVDALISFGKIVNISVDKQLCLNSNQDYFNHLHKIYEKNYDGKRNWLDYHEHIHLCELYFTPLKKYLCIDYREKSGLLEKNMRPEWLESNKTIIQPGEIYIQWSELGKTPYHYWENKEPNELTRMCQLAKPWLKLRPKIYIALEETNRLENLDLENFNSWWSNYQEDWCKYWNIPAWTVENMFGVKIFGRVDQVDLLIQQLQNNFIPKKVQL